MRVLRCGCGYEQSADLYDFEYHNNNGCGHEYIETKFVEKVYLIFTRHTLTESQIEEIKQDAEQFDGGIQDCEIIYLTKLASQNIESLGDAERIYDEIVKMIKVWEPRTNQIQIYGVIPTPLRFISFNKKSNKHIIVYESFNVNRAAEGEKPQFSHAGWFPTGLFNY